MTELELLSACEDSSESKELSASRVDLEGETNAGEGAAMSSLVIESAVDKVENCCVKVGTGMVDE